MPRDNNGDYTLPAGNPVNSGTTITSQWANSTFEDVADALTDSLDRNGRGGMAGPFQNFDGTEAFPGIAWANELSTGLYRAGLDDMRVSVIAQDVQRWQSTGSQLWNSTNNVWDEILTGVVGNTTVPPGTVDLQILEWDQTGSVWDVAAPLVKIPEGNASGQIIEWSESNTQWELGVQTGGSGGDVAPGTNNGNMLRWDSTFVAWRETFAIQVDDSGNVLVTGLVDGRNILADGIELDDHVGDSSIHFTMGSIDHTQILNRGSNSHAQIDSHIATSGIHFNDAPSGSGVPYSRQDGGWVPASTGGGSSFWDESGVDLVPNNDGVVKGVFSTFGVKNSASQMQTLTQGQYDGITVDNDTIYFII
jgi:hypothetical protein